MIFEIESNCFQKNPKTINLLEMANTVLRGRHRLYVRDVNHVDYQNWISKLEQTLFEIWDRSLGLSMELEAREPARRTVKVCNKSERDYSSRIPVLDVEEASHLAMQPYRVFVENDDADRDFLLTFSDIRQKEKIADLEKMNLIRFEHCGGISELNKKIIKFAGNSPLNSIVCAAVFDSDAPQPEDASRDAGFVNDSCDAQDIKAFMLKRRAIENYLMRSWINTWVNGRPKANRPHYIRLYKCFCELNQQQRSHFHMKRGLSVDKAKIADGTIALYNDVSDNLLRQLETGFGSNVGSDLYSSSWVQNSQPSEDPEAWDEVNGVVREILVLCR